MSYQGQSPKVNRLRLNPRSSDPLNPSEGDLQYADGSVREEGVWVYKNSAWVKVGSGQAGDINYLTNGDAEAGNTSGWSLGNVTLTNKFPSGVPTFGSGASGTLSFTNTSSSPLAGTRSFALTDSAATTAGNFLASDAFTIDAADLAKVLSIDITYQVTSGTINASGTSSNSLGIAIYDVTASQWIMPAGVWAITQTSGAGRAVATFQTPITSTQYRLVIFNANATSGAVSLKLDRLSVGPVSIPIGAPVTDWQSYTPTFTGFGTVTTQSFQWRRVGSNVEIRGRFTTGTVAATEARLSLPPGLTSSSSILTLEKAGTADRASGFAAGYFYPTVLIEPSVTYVTFGAQGSGTAALVKRNGADVFQSSEPVSLNISLPVAGWSSQVQMSNDTDTRVVAARARVGTGAATTAGNPVNFEVVDFDTHGAISPGATTWKYTVPVAGIYRVSASVYMNGAIGFRLFKNGVGYANINNNIAGSAYPPGSTTVNCVPGDTLSVAANVTATPQGASGYTIGELNFISIERLSGPAVVAANETVAASYWVSANFAASTTVPVNFDSKEFDSHNAVTTSATAWKFTAPVSGTYNISGYFQNTGTSISLVIYKNGVAYKFISACTNTAAYGTFSSSIKLNAGDYIDLRPNVAATFIGGTLASATTSNISITRVGN